MEKLIHFIKELVDIVDSRGGHILLATTLGLTGVWLAYHGHEMAAAQLLSFLGIAAYAMRGDRTANGAPKEPSKE